MRIYDIHDAQLQLSRLADLAANGQPFIIAKSGNPIVKVMALKPQDLHPIRRIGFLAGQIKVPDDFDRMEEKEILSRFEGIE